jgi:adenylate cyclase
MEKDKLSRKLAVILHADVVGSTLLVQKNETLAHERIQGTFQRFTETIHDYGGITHELRGDALVAEFDRASDAVAAAIAFQANNEESNPKPGEDIIPSLRIGISMGEVVIADNTITGAGVVLAQRLEQLADSGGVVVQGSVSETVPSRMPFEFESMGEQVLKGFDQPTRAFIARLQHGEEVPPPEKTVATHDEPRESKISDKPSVAVLPFTNMSDDSNLEHFCDGLTEDIITALSRTRWHNVTSRNSTFAYKNTSPDVREVAAAFGVDYVLEGSVRKGGNQSRITAQLIDAKTGNHVWADRYNRQMEDEFEIQDEIAHRVASILAERIWQDVAKNITYKRPEVYGPFDYAYLGIELLHRIEPDQVTEAIINLNKAHELEPDLIIANLGLGFCYLLGYAFWDDPSGEGLDLAYKHAVRLKDLAPDDAQTYRLLSRVYTAKRQFDEAMRCTERALKINPDDGDIIGNKGLFHLYYGEAQQAIEWFDKVLDLHSETPHTLDIMRCWKSIAQFILSRYDEAVATLKSITGLEYLKSLFLAACYTELELDTEAKAMSRAVLSIRPNLHVQDLGICNSFRHEEDQNHLRQAFEKAGIPSDS